MSQQDLSQYGSQMNPMLVKNIHWAEIWWTFDHSDHQSFGQIHPQMAQKINCLAHHLSSFLPYLERVVVRAGDDLGVVELEARDDVLVVALQHARRPHRPGAPVQLDVVVPHEVGLK